MKKYILLITTILINLSIFATNVNVETAKLIGENFLKQQGQTKSNLELIYTSKFQTIISSEEVDMSAFYVFSNQPLGFIMVSADDIIQPILAYSLDMNIDFDDLAPSLDYWLNLYKEQIKYAITNNGRANEETIRLWKNLRENSSIINNDAKAVSNLLATTWNQLPYYNQMCPSNCPTGCVATAMAQIMKYWNWPETGVGSHSYSTSTVGGTLSADFENTTYDWNNMPNNLTSYSSSAQKQAVATLMYHCGVSVNMNYTPDGSGAFANPYNGHPSYANCSENAFKTYFKYKSSLASYYRDNYSGVPNDNIQVNQWKTLLRTEFDEGRPVLYAGSSDEVGHAWVACGYDNNDGFYMNWGWGPNGGNGFYTVNNLASSAFSGGDIIELNNEQSIIIGIEPVEEMKVPATGNNSYYVCSGTIYDNGGSEGNYSGDTGSPQEGYTILYPETIGNSISISGSYSVETDCDYIYIYNGEGINGTLLATLTGTGTLSNITSTAVNGSLTIRFKVDNYVSDTGFAFDISCSNNPYDASLRMASYVNITPSSIEVGDAFEVKVKVRNTGDGNFTGNVKASIYNSSNTFITDIQQVSLANSPISKNAASDFLYFTSEGMPNLTDDYYFIKILAQVTESADWELVDAGNYNNSAKLTIIQNQVSIENNISENVNIFPNPANNIIVIENAENANYQISDLLGNIIKEDKISSVRQEINIENIKNGSYFIKIKTENNTIVKKFIKL